MLILHRAEGTAALADALGRVLAEQPADPFTPEVIAVPAKGVERWLTQRLSTVLGTTTGDGVAANIEFPSPTRLVDEAIAAATGLDPDADPWATGRLVWTLLGVIDECLDQPWCTVLRAHLTGPEREGRRYATAEHLTQLFRSYSAQRPQEFDGWLRGADEDVPEDLRWQVELWRRVATRIGEPEPPAGRLLGAARTLREQPSLSRLPERLSLFGPTRLTTEQLVVLEALSEHREVHLWLPHASPGMWGRLRRSHPVARRREDTSAELVVHPLLASLARDSRELQQQLMAYAVEERHHGDPHPPRTLLEQLQEDLRLDRAPTHAPQDSSVAVHACHGPSRQVEVLREALLHLFEDDPVLQPRDVLIMCPDVETYAPLVRAAFGQGRHGGHPGHRLRVRLADRALRQTNPLLDTVAALLELADGRVTASQVLDLAARPPVRRRFAFTDDDLERLRAWATDSGVRWGIKRRQREAYGLLDVPQNTWTTGLDRILLGVAADESELTWLGNALPLDDVDSSDIDLAGRLAELVDRLEGALFRLRGPQPAQAWTANLSEVLEWLTDTRERDAWQLAEARRELAAATEHAGAVELRLADVRAMLATRLAGRPTRANFRTGELTVCTMVPMRSVPHKVVVLLGLDDEVFPRGGGVDGDDIMARDPVVGERDPRSEDRQLLLDAVMSAGQRLVILYSGADPVSGTTRPPAVPLGEVLDVLTVMTGVDNVVRSHPLQPFDASNFDPAHPFSHDVAALAGARAAAGTRVPEPLLLPAPLPPVQDDVSLASLVSFVQQPVQGFLRQRLGVYVPDEEDEVADALRAELDGLRKWDIGDRWLNARLTGTEIGAFRQAEWRRGTLPPGRLGLKVLADLEQAVEALAVVSLPVHSGPSRTVDVALDLGGGRLLSGSVTGIFQRSLASTSYSTLAPKHRLAAWVKLLAVAAAEPGEWRAVTTGKGPWRKPAWRSVLIAPENALAQLRALVALRDEGLQAPLPIASSASAAYADRRAGGSTVEEALEGARKEFDSMFGDRTDRHLAYVLGPDPRFDQLLAEPDPEEGYRFGALARRLWAPLLAHESLGPP